MNTALARISTEIQAVEPPAVPALIHLAGDKAAWRFVDFFAATIRNPNTREAYGRAVWRFFDWCDLQGVEDLRALRPMLIAAYIETLLAGGVARPSVKQHLAAIRKLFDWLTTGGVLDANPASPVQSPKHIVRQGKTPVLDATQTRHLLDSIPLDSLAGLRDRALIGVMVYTFGRVGAVAAMQVEDYYLNGKRWWFRLHEKGGKEHMVPAHHLAEEYVDAWLAAAGIAGEPKTPLFRSINRCREITENSVDRRNVLQMIKRRARNAGLPATTCCHTFRATAITNYLENGGDLEHARAIAAHESSQTTRLYDRSGDKVTVAEIERIRI